MSDISGLKSAIMKNFGTPCAVIDLDIVDRNIRRAQELCDVVGIANRPHIKTHKSPVFALKQLRAGAKGITCQKLGEARVMAEAGIKDILIATNVLGASRSGQLTALLASTPLKVSADNQFVLAQYSKAAATAGRALEVLIECDTGQKRAGVEKVSEALELIRLIMEDKWLSFSGLLFYPPIDGWADSQTFLDEIKPRLSTQGISFKIISTGGTPNFANIGKLKGATEHRAGTCIFNDRMMIKAGYAKLEDCALNIFSSVVSRGGENRGILDAGSKTFTSDTGGLDDYGFVLEHPEARIHKFAEEHGFLDLSKCKQKPVVGDIVRVIPNHACVTINMFDQVIGVRHNEISEKIQITARGMLV